MGRVNQMLLTEEPFVAPPSTIPLVRISKEREARSGGLFNPAIKLDFDSIAKGHALLVAGPTEWEAVATGMGIGYVLLVDAEGTLHMNQWMAERIELVDGSARVAPARKSAEGSGAADP
jgi:hypothetical protein